MDCATPDRDGSDAKTPERLTIEDRRYGVFCTGEIVEISFRRGARANDCDTVSNRAILGRVFFAEKADLGALNDAVPAMSAFTSTGKSLILLDAHF